MSVSPHQARRLLSCLDLTSLSGRETIPDIENLCARATGSCGQVAAVCIFSRFLPQARVALEARGARGVRLATVVNFPAGALNPSETVAEIRNCLALGADEIDLVFPYHAFMSGQAQAARDFLQVCRAACPEACFKVILETGELATPALIRAASFLAIECGADFLKTSTGKSSVHATPEAARIMLETIAAQGGRVGFKASGGLKRAADAQVYFELAEAIFGPEWVSPATFRLGASGLLDDLLSILRPSPDPCVVSV